MTVSEYLLDLSSRHKINIDLVENELRVKAASSSLTDEVINEIRGRKVEIIDFLRNSCNKETASEMPSAFYRASPAQKRLFFLQEIDKQSLAYNMTRVFNIEGFLNIDRLENAFRELVKRHKILRTNFEVLDGEIVQAIRLSFTPVLSRYEQVEDGIDDLIRDLVRPFDLRSDPLIRMMLIETGENRKVLVIDIHHIICDATSYAILMEELIATYNDLDLPEITNQYFDYCEWTISSDSREKSEKQKSFWLGKFKDEVAGCQLPTDFPPTNAVTQEAASYSIQITKTLWTEIESFANIHDTTVFMVLLSVYNIMIAKVANCRDVVVATPTLGRSDVRWEKVVGMFVNTVVLRNDISSELPFLQLLDRVTSNVLDCFDNQDYQYDDLLSDLSSEWHKEIEDLFETMFVFQNFEEIRISLEDLKITEVQTNIEFNKFKLVFLVDTSEIGHFLKFRYSKSLFLHKTIGRWADLYIHILTKVIAYPNRRLATIPLITDEERDLVLNAFNRTENSASLDEALIVALERNFTLHATRTAIDFKGISMSYAELNEKADSLANTLYKRVSPGDRIALLFDPSIELVISILAILKMGCSYVPLSPESPSERNNYILHDCRPVLLLVHPDLYGTVYKDKLNLPEPVVVIVENASVKGCKRDFEMALIDGDSTIYIIYTSGTTGVPKGVDVLNKGVNNFIRNRVSNYSLSYSDVSLQLYSYHFDSYQSVLFSSLLSGGKLILLTDDERFNVNYVVESIVSSGVTNFCTTPGLYDAILSGLENVNCKTALRFVTLAGEQSPKIVLQRSKELLPHVFLANEYGPTEGSIAVTFNNELIVSDPAVIGKPIANSKIYILDKDLNPQPIGVPGDIYIGGHPVARGYINDVAQTNEKFISNPHAGGSLMYKTGDLGIWLDNGDIKFLGRADDQAKIRGYRIELSEIQTVILKYPFVNSAVVTILDKAGEKFLVAYYTSECEVGSIELRDFVKAKVPKYMVPSYYLRLDEIPITANGKIDKRSLPLPSEPLAPPQSDVSDLERALLDIYAEILQLDVNLIRTDSNFFELGGHSLRAIKLMYFVGKRLSFDLKLESVFDNPSVHLLSEHIKASHSVLHEAISEVEDAVTYEASSAQQRLYIQQLKVPESIDYNISSAILIPPDLAPDRISEILEKLLVLHPSLRTSFFMSPNGLIQKINAGLRIEFAEMTGDYDSPESAFSDFIRPFDLSLAPLVRISRYVENASRTYLFFDIHHIICDGLSLNIVVKDFRRLFNGERIEPPAISYHQYSAWQKSQQGNLELQKEYWLKKLSVPIERLDFPIEKERDTTDLLLADKVLLTIHDDHYFRIKKYIHSKNVSDFMFGISIFYILLKKVCGAENIIIGCDATGRTLSSLHDVVGNFVNILPLRVDVNDGDYFDCFIDKVRRTVLDAYSNQEFQFNDMVDLVGKNEDENRNPIFDVHFSIANTFESLNVFEDIHFEPVPLRSFNTTRYEFKIEMADSGTDFIFHFIYSKNLYSRSIVSLLASYFENIIKHVLDDTNILLGKIKIR